jgi:hypothetical protein
VGIDEAGGNHQIRSVDHLRRTLRDLAHRSDLASGNRHISVTTRGACTIDDYTILNE